MLELQGKYTKARIFTEDIDEASLAQIYQLCNQESMQGANIAIMPDVHMGSSCCVGTTIQLEDKVIPSLVGVDIGCGMETVKLKEKHLELARLDKFITQQLPSGSNIRKKEHQDVRCLDLTQLYCYGAIDEARAKKSLGTLGGGNHFIEVDKDEEGALYLVVHSGSRHLGVEVATFYQKLAYDTLNGCGEEALLKLNEAWKGQGKQQFVKLAKALKHTKRTAIPYLMSYLEQEQMQAYLHDIKIVQEYAALNRRVMADEMLSFMKLHAVERFATVHNYIDSEQMILRKGAISAKAGEQILIPMNMRDGALLCVGKGNPLWNYSAPHGAGRKFSRSEAKQQFTLSAYKKQMEGIYSTSISKGTLDECPMAYKDAAQIYDLIQDSADVVKVLKPIYNFKAGKEDAEEA